MFKPIFSLCLALAQTPGIAEKYAASRAAQECFESKEFLQSWDTSDFVMEEEIKQAFKNLANGYRELIEDKKRFIHMAEIVGLSELQKKLVDKNLITWEKEEQALENLSSLHLIVGQIGVASSFDLLLDHVLIRYATENGHACTYLQLKNSVCWHAGYPLPTFYRRDEKKLKQQAKELKKCSLLNDKKPHVSVHLSRKTPLPCLFSQSQPVFYTLELDFTTHNLP